MSKVIRGLVHSAIKTLSPARTPPAFIGGVGFKSCSYAKKDATIYTDNIQYCTGLLIRPKDIKKDSYYSFAHIEALEHRGDASKNVGEMIKGCSSFNKVDPNELSAIAYYRHFSSSQDGMLSSRAEENISRVESYLQKGGVVDIDRQSGGASSISTNGIDISEINVLSRMSSKLKNATYEKLINLRDETKNYRYIKHSGILSYDDKEVPYTDNINYCTAVLIKPKNIKNGDSYALLHLNAIPSIEKSETLVENAVNSLRKLNGADSVDMEYESYSRSWTNLSLAQLTADNLDHVQNLMGARGIHKANHNIGHSQHVTTDGKDICSGLDIMKMASLYISGKSTEGGR